MTTILLFVLAGPPPPVVRQPDPTGRPSWPYVVVDDRTYRDDRGHWRITRPIVVYDAAGFSGGDQIVAVNGIWVGDAWEWKSGKLLAHHRPGAAVAVLVLRGWSVWCVRVVLE